MVGPQSLSYLIVATSLKEYVELNEVLRELEHSLVNSKSHFCVLHVPSYHSPCFACRHYDVAVSRWDCKKFLAIASGQACRDLLSAKMKQMSIGCTAKSVYKALPLQGLVWLAWKADCTVPATWYWKLLYNLTSARFDSYTCSIPEPILIWSPKFWTP